MNSERNLSVRRTQCRLTSRHLSRLFVASPKKMLNRIKTWIRRDRQVDLSCVDPKFLRKTYRDTEWLPADLLHFVPVGCKFHSCKFESANFRDACFGGGREDCIYIKCSFDRSTIRAVAAGNARFVSCSFRDVEILEFFAFRVEMIDCVFSGIIRKAIFNGAVPDDMAGHLRRSKNQFERNDFSNARLDDVAFRTGIDLKHQKWPSGWKNEEG